MTKPAQFGLVDMGNIGFYNDPSNPVPAFTLSDLESNGVATFDNSFSEIVLNVTWAQLQPNSGSALDTSAIDSALTLVAQYNATNHTDLGIKLRVWGGYSAPAWAQGIDGTPLTVTGPGTVDPNFDGEQTIGRFWTADYIDAWTSLQQQLAQFYDSNPLIRGISNTAGAAATDEPFVPLHPNQMAQLVAGGYTDAAEELTLRAAISDYAAWSTTPLDYTMNPLFLVDGGKFTSDPDFTLAVLQAAVTSSRVVQAGNHALNNPLLASNGFVYAQMAAYAALLPGTPPASYQTASPVDLGSTANWANAVANGVTADAGNIELWDFPDDNGFTGQSPGFVANLATILAAGVPPTTGAPADGSVLAFIAPRSANAVIGAVALTGVAAVLLESAAAAAVYNVTIVSTNGNTLLATGVPAGATLSFSGSLDQVNTTLASLTEAITQPGTDILTFTASDNLGDSATRSVGVVAAPSEPDALVSATPLVPLTSGDPVSYTWTGAGGNVAFANAANWTPAGGPPGATDTAIFSRGSSAITVGGTGSAGTLVVDTAVVLGGGSTIAVGDASVSSGALIIGGVDTTLTVAGDLDIGGVLLAALAPGAYSTAALTVGATLRAGSGGTVRFSGELGANAIDVSNGGAISGDGTLTTAGTAIANDGVIEAVADQTLGLQQLTLADAVTGTGHLVVDPAATLILAGSVGADQTIDFVPNSIVQFSDDPYSPSTLVLQQPLAEAGTITGFSFADDIVLDGIDAVAPTATSYQNGTLTIVDQLSGGTLDFALSGSLEGMTPAAIVTGPTDDPTTTIAFVAAGLGILPSVAAPTALQAEAGATITVPDIVLLTPLPASPNNNTTILVTITAANGTLSAQNNDLNTTVGTLNGGGTLLLSGSLGSVERSLQTLTYTTASPGSDTIALTVSDYFGMSADTTIAVTIGSGDAIFAWAHPVDGNFGDAANWTTPGSSVSAPPGGANFAVFNDGTPAANSPYTVSGDGAVGRIVVADTVTLTGQVLAQGEGTVAVVVDGSLAAGGALTLSGGAVLTSKQQAIVGNAASGMLTVMGGALNLTNSDTTATALAIGFGSASVGSVLDFEQIAALGSVVVGGSGRGTLRLLGVAATVSDGGGDIGEAAGAQGIAVVDGGSWANAGQLIVGDGGTGSLLVSGAANGLTGQVTATSGTIGAQAGGSGTVMLAGGDLLIANAAPMAMSTLAVGGAGSGALAIDGGNVTVGAPLVSNGTTLYNGTLVVGDSGSIGVDNNGALLVEGGALIGSGTVAIGTGLLSLIGSLSIGTAGRVNLSNAGDTVRATEIVIGPGGGLSGAGIVSGDGGGNNTVLLTSIDNAGTITASGGDLLLYGGVAGNGALAIATQATLTLQAAVGAGQTLSFDSGGVAVLNDAMAFAGTIAGFAVGNTLDLASTSATGASWANNVLTLSTATGPVILNVAGSYASNGFVIQPDGVGGTEVALACFAAGTRIMTPNGPVAIEALTVGDPVVTHAGETRRITWFGSRHVDCRRHPRPDMVWPVRVLAGAFGPDCPRRDLYLSPNHAIYVEGVLIPVRYLVNGRTLRQMHVARVAYHHIELATHDVVLAEGLPAETFLDTGTRSAFANAPGVVDLHPDFSRVDNAFLWEVLGYAPLCVNGPIVERVRDLLAVRRRDMPRRTARAPGRGG